MNSMEALVQSSDSAMEAGLFVISAATTQFSNNKPSLEDQIQSASTHAHKASSKEHSSIGKSIQELPHDH